MNTRYGRNPFTFLQQQYHLNGGKFSLQSVLNKILRKKKHFILVFFTNNINILGMILTKIVSFYGCQNERIVKMYL